MSVFRNGWYVIYTKPRHERRVSVRLTEMRIESFLPTKKVLRTWHDRKKFVEEPLFPSYVFVYLNDIQNYYEGIDADGALYYLRTGKEVARVNDIVIENLKLITCEGMDVEVCNRPFQKGQKAVIQKGPLTGLSCEVVFVNDNHRLLVRVDLLQRNILLNLTTDFVLMTDHSMTS